MKVTILEKENKDDEDEIIVKCGLIDDSIMNLLNSLRAGKKKMTFMQESKLVLVEPKDISYFESVDDRTFAYTGDKVFETKTRIYQLEEELSSTDFFRVSKSMIVNLNKIKSLVPAFGGRLEATLEDGFKVIISRMYVPKFKEIVGL